MLNTLWRNRSLVLELTKREFTGRYRGSFGGVSWAILQPLFVLAIYTVAFGLVMGARWAGAAGGTLEYAFILFSGLLVFNAFAECLNRAPKLIVANPNFVKKVVFPLEVLPWAMVLSVVVHLLLALAVWLFGYLLCFGLPKLTVLYAPVVLLAFLPVLIGVGWLFSAAGVIFRDLDQITGMVVHGLLFLTPIFYSIDTVPPAFQSALNVNPLTFVVEQMRLVLFIGQVPDFSGLLVYFSVATAFCLGALVFFRRLSGGFADYM